MHRSVSLPFYDLRAGLVALDENFVSAFRVGQLLKRRVESDQLVGKENNRNGRDSDDEPGELPFAPVRKHFAGRNVRRAFHSLRRHFEGPRDENRDNEPERDQYNESRQHPLRRVEGRQQDPSEFNQQPCHYRVKERDLINVAPLQFRKQRRLVAHEGPGKPSLASKFL